MTTQDKPDGEPAPGAQPPPAEAPASAAPVGDLLSGFSGAVAEAFAVPLRSVATALAAPWQQFGQDLSASWSQVAAALASQYQTVLSSQMQQIVGTYQSQLADALRQGGDRNAALERLKERLAGQSAEVPQELKDRLHAAARKARAANEALAASLQDIAQAMAPAGGGGASQHAPGTTPARRRPRSKQPGPTQRRGSPPRKGKGKGGKA